ncbi:TrbI/VirB10 family protein [Sphingomonas sp. PB2P12]
MPIAVIVVVAVLAGVLLFTALNARRQSLSAPAISERIADIPSSTAPPTLYVPPEPPEVAPASQVLPQQRPAPIPVPPAAVFRPQPAPTPTYGPPVFNAPSPVSPPPRNAGGAALVVDTTQAANGAAQPGSARQFVNPLGLPSQAGATTERARAGMLANRATTVPQGTLIPVVLETGFDSTRPGYARALVQRDIRGFDGSQVLIPRGSRLVGEYGADTAPGQKRAMIAWARLIRPDGMTIDIGSPAADTVGRGGVRAKVNSHFLEHFAGAILQSSLDIGVNLASRGNNGTVVVLPGSTQGISSSVLRPNEIRPTLTVPPGTSVSVFVARDLDFTTSRSGP